LFKIISHYIILSFYAVESGIATASLNKQRKNRSSSSRKKFLEERQREEEVGEVVRDNTFRERPETFLFILSPVLRVPRQCPLCLLVEVCLKGDALGNKKA
jgi:hypothetical protein